MRKGVAIGYIIALILGVIVIGLLGYFFLTQGSKTSGAGIKAECNGLCFLWRNSAFNLKPANIGNVCGIADETILRRECATQLGCRFSNPCSNEETSYGKNTAEGGNFVCCK